MRKKRGIPVAPPRLPSFEGNSILVNSSNFSNTTSSSNSIAQKLAPNTSSDACEQSGINSNDFNFNLNAISYEKCILTKTWLSLSHSNAANNNKVRGNTPSDGSDLSNEETELVEGTHQMLSKNKPKRSFHLRRRAKPPTQSHSIPESNYGESNSPPMSSVEANHNNSTSFSIDNACKSLLIRCHPKHNRFV